MKQNPFSLYDFLGYIIPGLFVMYSYFIICQCKTMDRISIQEIFNSFPTIRIEGIVLIVLISYSLGHVISFVSSITVERYSIWKYGYPSRYLLGMPIHKFRAHFKTCHGIFWGLVMIFLLLPTIALDFVLGKFFGFKYFYGREIDTRLAKVVIFKINQLEISLGLTESNGFHQGDGTNSDFFRIVQHYTYDNSTNHQSKFTNYVALYGFLRTMTLLFNLLFWYLVIHFYIIDIFNIHILISILITSAFSYTFFMAYMKFYRRYTLEGFMVLVVDKEIKNLKSTHIK